LRTSCIHKAENILKEAKGRVPKRQCASADEQEFALLLLLAGLVDVRKLSLSGHRKLGLLECLIVELKSVVGFAWPVV